MTLKGRRTKFGGARDLRKRLVIGFGSTPREKSSAERDQLGLSTGHSLFGALVVALVVIATGIGFTRLHGREAAGPQSNANTATYVGSAACATCHEAQSRLWQGSHHQQAMAHATASTVLGNFDDATFDYNGVRSRFSRRDGKFIVETDDAFGKVTPFEVKYTFGVFPLQQYLIELTGGRVQALSLAWDSRPAEKGGQRWFHLYPGESINHEDVLHWTKLNQNWNFMCAECHSTGVQKNYDAANDRYATTFAEISVGCESCHGKGSGHVTWARAQESWWPFSKSDDSAMGLLVRFTERKDATWKANLTTGNSDRSRKPRTLRAEVETCGVCHARRSQFSEAWIPGQWLSDTHIVSHLSPGLYESDGQIHDEVYEYGSFKQSKMFAAGVTCSDCHEPHSSKLRAEGNGVCLQCHSSDKYASLTHHQHADATISCASCHMPTRTYMGVDARHDHSIRVPRPDLSTKVGTPNACNACHADKSSQWAASTIEGWFGSSRKGFQTYGNAFHSAWTDQPDAARLLAAVAEEPITPAIARASALSELASRISASNLNVVRVGLADPDPMVRIGALDVLENVLPAQMWPLASPLLSDPSSGPRIRAASLLASVPTARQPPVDRERFERAAAEFVTAQRLNADRPEARTTLGNFFARRGLFDEAEGEYKAGLRLSAQYTPAAINLADLYRQRGKDADGERVILTALTSSPRDGGLHHALGLILIRQKRLLEALVELKKGTDFEPARERYSYVYAVALHSAGHANEAREVLKGSLQVHPNSRELLQALIAFSRDAGDLSSALDYAERFAALSSSDPSAIKLVQDLKRLMAEHAAPVPSASGLPSER